MAASKTYDSIGVLAIEAGLKPASVEDTISRCKLLGLTRSSKYLYKHGKVEVPILARYAAAYFMQEEKDKNAWGNRKLLL